MDFLKEIQIKFGLFKFNRNLKIFELQNIKLDIKKDENSQKISKIVVTLIQHHQIDYSSGICIQFRI